MKLWITLIFLLLLSACSNHKSETANFKNIKEQLAKATDYEDYLHGPVQAAANDIEEKYLENPTELCDYFYNLNIKDLLVYRETLELLSKEVICIKDALNAIELYYGNYYESHLKNKQARLENKTVILDKAYSLPTENPLPNKVLNLTFDDGPHEAYTHRVLETLSRFQVKANFFVVGNNVKKYPKILKDTALKGHSIGGHSMTHASLNKLSFEIATKEIMGVFDVIEKILGGADPFFRFPYGARTPMLRKYLAQNNISDFFWSVDTLDWKYKDPDFLLNYALTQTKKSGRGIVLFHDVQPQTSAILPAYLNALAEQGYKTVIYEPK